MGIQGLLPLLKSIQKTTHLKSFSGCTLAIDAYGWLHKGTIACATELALGKPTRKYIDYVLDKIYMLQHFGIIPYVVFDGDYLPSKATTEIERKRKRDDAKSAGMQLFRAGQLSAAYIEFQKAIEVTPRMACSLIDDLRKLGVQFVVAPYEADAQMAFLEHQGLVSGVISEDSDLLVFGVKRLITKLDQYGNCVEINRHDFSSVTDINLSGWTDTEFRHMCILSGCDYLTNIPRMGLKTAYRLIRRYRKIEKIFRVLQSDGAFIVPPTYIADFEKADLCFLYQRVFCTKRKCLVHCCDLDESQLLERSLDFLGASIPDHVAIGIATGRLDPITKERIQGDVRKNAQSQVTQFFQVKQITTRQQARPPLATITANQSNPVAAAGSLKQPIITNTSLFSRKHLKRSFGISEQDDPVGTKLENRLCSSTADQENTCASPFFPAAHDNKAHLYRNKRMKTRISTITLNPAGICIDQDPQDTRLRKNDK